MPKSTMLPNGRTRGFYKHVDTFLDKGETEEYISKYTKFERDAEVHLSKCDTNL